MWRAFPGDFSKVWAPFDFILIFFERDSRSIRSRTTKQQKNKEKTKGKKRKRNQSYSGKIPYKLNPLFSICTVNVCVCDGYTAIILAMAMESSDQTLFQPLLPPPSSSSSSSSASPPSSDPKSLPAHDHHDFPPPSSSELPLPPTSSTITPYHTCSYLSLFLFSWLNPILQSGFSKSLRLQDVPRLSPQDSAATLFRTFSDAWTKKASHVNNNEQVSVNAKL